MKSTIIALLLVSTLSYAISFFSMHFCIQIGLATVVFSAPAKPPTNNRLSQGSAASSRAIQVQGNGKFEIPVSFKGTFEFQGADQEQNQGADHEQFQGADQGQFQGANNEKNQGADHENNQGANNEKKPRS